MRSNPEVDQCFSFFSVTYGTIILLIYSIAQFKLYTRVQTHACVLAHLTCVKLQKLECARTVARNFGVRTRPSEHTHELALGLPHYTCGVTTGTVAVGKELQLFCG